jgi:2-amino-4-hydroxy-6-hydroxymethyldihydropteridine diphosphokinase
MLELPHPRLHLRKFVLVPLDEIIPGFMHPVLGKSMHALLGECEDASLVRVFSRSL